MEATTTKVVGAKRLLVGLAANLPYGRQLQGQEVIF